MITGSSDGRWWQNGYAGSKDTDGRMYVENEITLCFDGWAVIGQELGF